MNATPNGSKHAELPMIPGVRLAFRGCASTLNSGAHLRPRILGDGQQQQTQLAPHRRRNVLDQVERQRLRIIERDLRRLWSDGLRANRDRTFHAVTVAWPCANRVALW